MAIDKENMKKSRFPVWYWLTLPLVFILLSSFFLVFGTDQLAHSEFKKLLRASNVEKVWIADDVISEKLKPAGLEAILPAKKVEMLKRIADNRREFSTQKVEGPSLVSELEDAGVVFAAQPGSTRFPSLLFWVIPMLIALWLFSWFCPVSTLKTERCRLRCTAVCSDWRPPSHPAPWSG